MQFNRKYLSKFIKSDQSLIFFKIATGLICSLTSLFAFIEASEYAVNKSIIYFDAFFATLALEMRTPLLTKIMLFFTHLGGPIFLAFAVFGVCMFLLKKYTKEAVLFFITMSTGVVLNAALKIAFDRQRPQLSPLVVEFSKSFPSGHAMNNFIFYSLLVFLIFHISKNKKPTLVASFFAVINILMIGFSRIYLGAHYFSDVLAGFIAGFWWLTTVFSAIYIMALCEIPISKSYFFKLAKRAQLRYKKE